MKNTQMQSKKAAILLSLVLAFASAQDARAESYPGVGLAMLSPLPAAMLVLDAFVIGHMAIDGKTPVGLRAAQLIVSTLNVAGSVLVFGIVAGMYDVTPAMWIGAASYAAVTAGSLVLGGFSIWAANRAEPKTSIQVVPTLLPVQKAPGAPGLMLTARW